MSEKITIQKSQTADTRTCDWSKVTREQLYVSSVSHLADVRAGMALFAEMVRRSGERHDFDKLTAIEHFHSDFRTGFKETGWWDDHRKINRHHLAQEDGVPGDVNLVDVLEYVTDCVMAGLARSGSVYDVTLPDDLLQRAFANTVELLKSSVVVADAAPPTAGGGEGKHNDFCDSRELSPLLGPSEKPCNCGAIVEKPEPPKLPLPIGHEFVGCGLGSLDPRVESVSSHRNWCHALGCGQPLTAHEER